MQTLGRIFTVKTSLAVEIVRKMKEKKRPFCHNLKHRRFMAINLSASLFLLDLRVDAGRCLLIKEEKQQLESCGSVAAVEEQLDR